MRGKMLIGALAFGLVIADPAICAQTAPPSPDGSQPEAGEVEDPANPNPMPDPSNPVPPVTDPLPPEMPMPAGEAQQIPPVVQRAPPATAPSAGEDAAVSGSTTATMMSPQQATKPYPPCSKTLQDNCRNPGEGPKRR